MSSLLTSGILGYFIKLFVEAFAKAGMDWLGEFVAKKEADEKIRQEAVMSAENETLKEIAETADAQAKVNAADRGGASDVARRVRARLEAKRRGSSLRRRRERRPLRRRRSGAPSARRPARPRLTMQKRSASPAISKRLRRIPVSTPSRPNGND